MKTFSGCGNRRAGRSIRALAPRLLAICSVLLCAPCPGVATTPTGAQAEPRIAAMKANPRGPFARIRWFCVDGSILPPAPNACKPRGGGAQHGEWSATTQALRAAGYYIANVYADLDIEKLLSDVSSRDLLGQLAIERFLQRIDDGWILRLARSYRGALQEEGERAGARRLLLAMAADKRWLSTDYLTWRTLAALLPHGADTASARSVRQDASMLAERDPDFLTLKNKIHIAPAAEDAAAVRDYAARLEDPALATALTELAEDIEALHARDTAGELERLAQRIERQRPDLAAAISAIGDELAAAPSARARAEQCARLLQTMRAGLARLEPLARLQMLDSSRAIETEYFVAASELLPELGELNRRERLQLLAQAADALHATGLLSEREHTALARTQAELARSPLSLAAYREAIDYLGLVPGWGERRMQLLFGPAQARLGEIEPLARLFVQDQLRGSVLFIYAAIIDSLQRDAYRLAEVEHRLFESRIGGGLRALNPGLAHGVLRDGRGLDTGAFERNGIYLLHETIADLPPVAGIITAGPGNPLSHVQLLARNLGIPNVSVSHDLLEQLEPHEGERVVLAVSPGGVVQLSGNTAEFSALFARAGEPMHLIEPDIDKLDLSIRQPIPLSALHADDSGRIVGPKAAQLGELKAHYPEAVGRGLALPFGVFRGLLDAAGPDGVTPMFDYLVAAYRRVETLPAGSAARIAASDALRESIQAWVSASTVPAELAATLRTMLTETLGRDGEFGVFVRSDTNVEDLPGFTGAGLNLTVPHVVGLDAILAAIPRVWASPFTARAFAWRQSLMRQPEHVYPAVLLLQSVNADKSGVLVTQDIDTGDRGWFSVAVNEGVGGAVDGQSAESLRIHLHSGQVRLLAQASASNRRQLAPGGGIATLPASGRDTVLSSAEIAHLIAFVRELPQRFPTIVDARGEPAPADVEFGFEQGALRLFQIRPFLDSAAARGNAYLTALDRHTIDPGSVLVDLYEGTAR